MESELPKMLIESMEGIQNAGTVIATTVKSALIASVMMAPFMLSLFYAVIVMVDRLVLPIHLPMLPNTVPANMLMVQQIFASLVTFDIIEVKFINNFIKKLPAVFHSLISEEEYEE